MENNLWDNLTNVKLTAQSLPEQVAEKIRQFIIERHLEIGDKLPNEFELAEQLNVGRGSIREAVKLLVARNVLEIQRGKGTFIAKNTGIVDDPFGFSYMEDEERLVRELFQIRVEMEPWIAGLAAENATDEQAEELRKILLEMRDLIAAGESGWAMDRKLHVTIAACTQNRVLPMLIPVITYSVHLFEKHNKIALVEQTDKTHEEIVNAIAAHNPQRARKAMLDHLALNLKTIPALKGMKIPKE